MSVATPDLSLVYWLAQVAMSFCVYSFAGWAYEVVIGLFQHHRFINRGFNFGPVCPIYGVGAVLAIVGLAPLGNPLLQFVVGFFAAGVLEYLTSWVMEALFHARWWDYSEYPLNLNGRICALGLTVFSVLMLGVNYLSEPFLKSLYVLMDPNAFVLLAASLLMVFAMDFTASVVCMQGFMDKLRVVQTRIGGLSSKAREALAATVHVAREGIPDIFLAARAATPTVPEIVAGIGAAKEKLSSMGSLGGSALDALPSIADVKAALKSVIPGIRELRDDVLDALRNYADPQVRGELAEKLRDVEERGWSRYERKALSDPWFHVTQSSEAFEWARQAFPFLATKKSDSVQANGSEADRTGVSGDSEQGGDGVY